MFDVLDALKSRVDAAEIKVLTAAQRQDRAHDYEARIASRVYAGKVKRAELIRVQHATEAVEREYEAAFQAYQALRTTYDALIEEAKQNETAETESLLLFFGSVSAA